MSTKPNGTPDYGAGYLEISEKGFGFLRSAENHFQPKPTDIFVTPDTIKKNFLREGCHVAGPLQPPHRGVSSQLKAVDKVNEMLFAFHPDWSTLRRYLVDEGFLDRDHVDDQNWYWRAGGRVTDLPPGEADQ